MANTTDLMITSFFDDDAIESINLKTGLDFKQFSDGAVSGGPKVLSFEVFGTCVRCIGIEKINELIDIFKSTEFSSPEFAILHIDDDDGKFSGIVTR